MEKKNYEVRFKCDKETFEVTSFLYSKGFNEIKKQSWYLRVFLLGLNSLKDQILKQGQEEVLQKLFKKK